MKAMMLKLMVKNLNDYNEGMLLVIHLYNNKII